MPGFNNGCVFAENGFDFTGADGSTVTNALGGSNSGITNTITCQNTSNTASSQASFKALVGGASSGDCWTQYTIGTANSWSIGPDNSASDVLKINHSASGSVDPSSGTNLLTIDQTVPNATFSLRGLSTSFANIGDASELSIFNTDNTNAGSAARVTIGVGGTSAGDAYTLYSTGTNSWEHGVDNSDTQSWNLLSQSTAATDNLSGNINMKVTAAGEVTFPRTPAFLAILSATLTDATGDATVVTPVFDTEIYDQNADYNNATGVFTAPVTGRYRFSCTIAYLQLGAAHTLGNTNLTTSNRNLLGFNASYGVIRTSANDLEVNCSWGPVDMDAADTANISLFVSNSTKTVDIQGSSSNTFFAGELVC